MILKAFISLQSSVQCLEDRKNLKSKKFILAGFHLLVVLPIEKSFVPFSYCPSDLYCPQSFSKWHQELISPIWSQNVKLEALIIWKRHSLQDPGMKGRGIIVFNAFGKTERVPYYSSEYR